MRPVGDPGTRLRSVEVGGPENREIRSAGRAGLVAGVLLIVPVCLTARELPHVWPTVGESTPSIVAWLSAHRATGMVQTLSNGVGLVLWIWFVAGLTSSLERASRRSAATRLLIPAVCTASLGLQIANTAWVLLLMTGRPGYPVGGFPFRAVFGLTVMVFCLSQFYVALLMLAAGCAMRMASAPTALSGSTLLIGVANGLGSLIFLVGEGPFAPFSLLSVIPFMLFSLWTLALSGMLLRGPAWGPGTPAP